jgi:hypothetical protein
MRGEVCLLCMLLAFASAVSRVRVSCYSRTYCTVLAVLVRDNRLGHLIIHTFYPDFTVGTTIALLQTQDLSNSRLSLFGGQLITR